MHLDFHKTPAVDVLVSDYIYEYSILIHIYGLYICYCNVYIGDEEAQHPVHDRPEDLLSWPSSNTCIYQIAM